MVRTMTLAQDIPLTIVDCSNTLPNWWIIERRHHDGREWMEETEWGGAWMKSARLADADIEGVSKEMLAIAAAIEGGTSVEFRRCEARWAPEGYLLSSPRNSSEQTLVTHQNAKELAALIRERVR